MKTKLVLWGTDTEEKRVLIAMELLADENQVKIWTFPEAIASDEFADKLMREWRNGAEVPFPEGYAMEEKELSVTESLLPEHLKVERPDIVQRAQTEWHFVVLSSKMNAQYESELHDIKERIEKLENFDNHAWEDLKAFWDKVQQQVRERNIFREHADNLRDKTNALFAKMKELRSQLDDEFRKASKEVHDKFLASVQEIEEKIEKGGTRLNALFDELKALQRQFKETDMIREHRSGIWERIDAAFKEVKMKRFGSKAGEESNPLERVQRRYKGLLSAIEKMEKSIKRDRDDLNFQKKKIDTTDGQLEAQIRQAKILMIEERIRSKEDKLGEMMQTKHELESRLESLKSREMQKAEREKIEAAKEAVKEKIAEEIKQAAEDRVGDEKIEKAAEAMSPEEKSSEKTPDAEKPAEDAEKKEKKAVAPKAKQKEKEEAKPAEVEAEAAEISEKVDESVTELSDQASKEEEE